MAGKAFKKRTFGSKISDMDQSTEKINVVATGSNIWSQGIMGTLTQPDNTNLDGRLKTSGDIMLGPLAISSFVAAGGESLIQVDSGTKTLSLGESDGAYSSRWIWATSGSGGDTLAVIEPAIADGALLFIENVTTETPTIEDVSTGTTDANIKTLTGSDFTFPSTKQIVLLMYSIIDGKWHMITDGGAGTVGADRQLNNLLTTSVNTSLYPSADETHHLGALGNKWDDLYIDDIYIYSGTASSGSSVSLGGYFRMYIGGTSKWIPYYS